MNHLDRRFSTPCVSRFPGLLPRVSITVATLVLTVLCVVTPASGEPFFASISVYGLAGCNEDSRSFSGPNNQFYPLTVVSSACEFELLNPYTLSTASVTLSSGAIYGAVATNDPFTVASASAAYLDTVTLDPPTWTTDLSVTLAVGTIFNASLGNTGSTDYCPSYINGCETFQRVAQATMTVTVPDFHVSQTAIASGGDGNVQGFVFTDQFTILNCNFCSFQFEIDGSAGAANGATASFNNDPVLLQLPPGWTYTLASEQVPEPSSVALAGIGLVCWFCLKWRAGALR